MEIFETLSRSGPQGDRVLSRSGPQGDRVLSRKEIAEPPPGGLRPVACSLQETRTHAVTAHKRTEREHWAAAMSVLEDDVSAELGLRRCEIGQCTEGSARNSWLPQHHIKRGRRRPHEK